MSAWRIVVRHLYALGGSGTAKGAGGDFLTPYQAGNALEIAAKHGLVKGPGSGKCVWSLTERGIDWCENRVNDVYLRPGGLCWIPTWLSSLPRGIRIVCESASRHVTPRHATSEQ
jgi:hypothetical protein